MTQTRRLPQSAEFLESVAGSRRAQACFSGDLHAQAHDGFEFNPRTIGVIELGPAGWGRTF